MQITRQRIIDLLRKQGQATVDELAEAVDLTQMAVRHHLNVLQAEDLIEVAHTKRQHKPGRPVQVYVLTEKARKFYPQEYFQLTDLLVAEVTNKIGRDGVLQIFDGIANRLHEEAPLPEPGESFETRLEKVATFLREKGFVVEWEEKDGEYIIHHLDCPYRQFAQSHNEVCRLDRKLIGSLLQVTPARVSCIAQNDDKCTYVLGPVQSQPVDLVMPSS